LRLTFKGFKSDRDLNLAHSEDVSANSYIFGNVGTIICFKVGIEDSEMLEKKACPEFKLKDVMNLDEYKVHLGKL